MSHLRARLSHMWSREDLAWAAGLFEGEGSIQAGTPNGPARQRLHLVMADFDRVQLFAQIVGVGRLYNKGPGTLGTKPLRWWICWRFEDVQAVLAMLWPWLGPRRRNKAREVLLDNNRRHRKHFQPTHCQRGHEFTPENTGSQPGGWRLCKTCVRMRQAMYKRGKRVRPIS